MEGTRITTHRPSLTYELPDEGAWASKSGSSEPGGNSVFDPDLAKASALAGSIVTRQVAARRAATAAVHAAGIAERRSWEVQRAVAHMKIR